MSDRSDWSKAAMNTKLKAGMVSTGGRSWMLRRVIRTYTVTEPMTALCSITTSTCGAGK